MIGYRSKTSTRQLELPKHAKISITKKKFYSLTNESNNVYEYALDWEREYTCLTDVLGGRFMSITLGLLFKLILLSIIVRRFYVRMCKCFYISIITLTVMLINLILKYARVNIKILSTLFLIYIWTISYIPLSFSMSTLHILFYYIVVILLSYTTVRVLRFIKNLHWGEYFYKNKTSSHYYFLFIIKASLLLIL